MRKDFENAEREAERRQAERQRRMTSTLETRQNSELQIF